MGRVDRLFSGAGSGEGGAGWAALVILYGAPGCQFAVSPQTNRDMSLNESFEFLRWTHEYNYRKQWSRFSFPRISVGA